jgi:hypothetical protein
MSKKTIRNRGIEATYTPILPNCFLRRRPEAQRELLQRLLLAWAEHARAAARLQHLLRRGTQQRCRRLLAAWQVC